jgi:hypothetical protein
MEKKTTTSSSEEIDLLYFFRPVGRALKNAALLAEYYLALLAHNRFLFAGILIAGAIGGYCLRYVIPPSYQTNAIFVSDMLPARYCVTLLENLNELRKPGNIQTLAKELNISINAAGQIQGIKPASSPRDTFSLEKRDSSMSTFTVTLTIHDMRYLDEVQKGLVSYLENNEYIRKRKAERARSWRLQIADLEMRRKDMDSLRKIVSQSIIPRSQGQGIILGEPINPVPIYQAEMAYLRERLYIEERLATIDHIEVLQPFFKLNEYNTPDYQKLMRYAFAASFLFALLVVPIIGRKPKPRVVRAS